MLGIPKCPKKKWDDESSFDNGIAVITRLTGSEDYAVCSYNKETDQSVRIIKDFGAEPFVGIVAVYPIPAYMDDNIEKMDIDDESREAMEDLLREKEEIINKDVEKPKVEEYEWGYDFIHNKQEAVAFLKTKKLKGNLPTKDEVIKAKLRVMYRNEQKNKK